MFIVAIRLIEICAPFKFRFKLLNPKDETVSWFNKFQTELCVTDHLIFLRDV